MGVSGWVGAPPDAPGHLPLGNTTYSGVRGNTTKYSVTPFTTPAGQRGMDRGRVGQAATPSIDPGVAKCINNATELGIAQKCQIVLNFSDVVILC